MRPVQCEYEAARQEENKKTTEEILGHAEGWCDKRGGQGQCEMKAINPLWQTLKGLQKIYKQIENTELKQKYFLRSRGFL